MSWKFRDRFEKVSSWEAALTHVIEAYQRDRLLGVPAAAIDVMRRTETPRFAILGTKDFGGSFAASVAGRYEIAFAVDDFKAHRGQRFHGVPIV